MGLDLLPVELLRILGVHCDYKQLSHLARLNRTFNTIFNPILYERNATDPLSPSCLHWATACDSLPTLKLALGHGADINRMDDVTDYVRLYCLESASIRKSLMQPPLATPLHLAIFQERFEIVQWLLDNGSCLDITARWKCGCSNHGGQQWYPLHFAICHSNEEILQLVLERGAFYSSKSSNRDVPGLRCAINIGSVSAVDALIQHSSFNPDYQDEYDFTPLHWVADTRRTEAACAIIEKLVQGGVPLNAQSEYGGTALGHLVQQGLYEPAITLLRHGADPTISDEADRGVGMLYCCFDERFAETIRAAEPGHAEKLKETRLELVKLIIAGGVDVNRRLGHGAAPFSRPLFWALVSTQDVRCIQVLLDAGADMKMALVESNDELTGEDFLRGFFDLFGEKQSNYLHRWDRMMTDFDLYKESLCLLLKKGARIDSGKEWTALSRACELERERGILTFLVENATRMNVELEHVVTLRDRYAADETIRKLLNEFHGKLAAEDNKLEGGKGISNVA
ncbi:hypothetical protein F53441_9785 [Fusarium austroafricanum]|uniref:F-box domain-containing protein n=1 Tax=Fusarium austroafricanum TaxID=2364996 RepID=A0A8H4KBQ6_9HYPO|nr:hypothetical protein F53441_9785 [Fusarium austroafricanum]